MSEPLTPQEKQMMKCGHAANGRMHGTDKPVCCICLGLTPDAEVVVEAPDLTGRTARCDCGRAVPSSTGLAFFKHRAAHELDSFYCGCMGWE